MNLVTLSNALKSVFGTAITPTSSQFVPITASDGAPAGISSMANLASVLGGLINRNIPSNNLSQITEQGIYVWGDTISNTPCTYGLAVAFVSGNYKRFLGFNLSPQSDLSDLLYVGYGTTWKKVSVV